KELPQESEFKFNRILDNKARELYNPIIAKLFTLAPEMMARKIPEANVQQAFVLDTVERFAAGITNPRLLCVGCYEDTAVASLKVLGYRIDEIDPALNYDLNTFFNLPTTQKASYDIIFSTSVIEHVQDDESFVRQIEGLLTQGGVAIITCDYNDTYRQGDYIPQEDFRLYTQGDFRERLMPMIPNCTLVDTPQWDCPEPDFVYAGCHYTFATLVFRKDTDADECFETLKLPHDQTVIPLYQRLLGRQPDVDERYHWNEMLRLGISIDDFADALMANPEYWNKKANEKRILLSLPRFKMFVMKNDLDVGSCLFKTLDYEPHVSGVLIELLRPGSVFMDIGANIGYFSLLAASIVGKEGKVISFEPNMQNVQLLYASLLENGFTNVLVFPFAVSDTQQILKIKSMCSNGILERSSVGRENVQSTQSIIVDNLLQNEHKIDVVKIDIEGHEPFALKSMKRLLQQHHPTILTEFSPWHIKRQAKIEPEDYLKQIVNYGYSLAIISEDGGTLVKAPTTDYIMCTWRALNNDKRQLDVMARPV
ncbi:FkbM family methyltransferase, partial [Patescibacteria group bacterium]|nr:FkbM family methyltransferase [Patescibacteria group bacterium]